MIESDTIKLLRECDAGIKMGVKSIDDVLDYVEFDSFIKDETQHIKIVCDVRVVSLINGKISSKFLRETYVMVNNKKNALELKDGANFIRCHNCGSSIDATIGKCEYCGTEINPLQEWVLKIETHE